MADKSDKLLQYSGSEVVQSGNGLTFSVSPPPPPRQIAQNGDEQITKLCNENRHIKTAHDGDRQAKYEAFCISPTHARDKQEKYEAFCISPPHARVKQEKYEAFCISPPHDGERETKYGTFCISPPQDGDRKAKNEAFCISPPQDGGRQAKYGAFCISPPGRNEDILSKPHFVQKLRNERMNAMKSIQRLPIKADHNIGHNITVDIAYTDRSFETENDNLPNSAPSTTDDGVIAENTFERKEMEKEYIPHPPMSSNTIDKCMLEWKIKRTHMLPSHRYTPSLCFDTNNITVCKNVQKTKRERGNLHSANDVRTELGGNSSKNRIIGHSDSAGSVFVSDKNTNIKQSNFRGRGGFQCYENCDTFLMSGDVKHSSPKLDKVKTVGIKRNGLMEERVGFKVLPPIRKSNQIPLVELEVKRKTHITTHVGTFSMVCNQNMVPVKVLHKDDRNNKMVYLTALIKKENITPFSITRQGSYIPISFKYLKDVFKKVNVTQFRCTPSITKAIPFAFPGQCLDELSNEFDDSSPEPDEIISNKVPTFSQEDSANGFNKVERIISPVDENDLVSNSHESLECKGMQPMDMPSESEKLRPIEREISVTSFGFTPEDNHMTNVDEVNAELYLKDERGFDPLTNESEMFLAVCESEKVQYAVGINAESSSRKSVGRIEELPSNPKPSDDLFECKSYQSLEGDIIGNGQNKTVINQFVSEEILSLATPPCTQNSWLIQSPKPREMLDGIGLLSPPESTRSLEKTPIMPKISRIPVCCFKNLDTSRRTPVRLYEMTTCNCQDLCGSSCNERYSKSPEIPSVNVNMSGCSQVFVPHPPKQKKPTLVSKINRFFSRNTKCCFK